jgi:hypothetical protein
MPLNSEGHGGSFSLVSGSLSASSQLSAALRWHCGLMRQVACVAALVSREATVRNLRGSSLYV